MNEVIKIKKGLQKEVLFYSLKAKYINYFMAIGLGALLFGVLLSLVINMFLAIGFIVISLIVTFIILYFYSKTYGENGFVKKIADSKIPNRIKGLNNFENILLWEKR